MSNQALPSEVIRLWPDGAPSKIDGVGAETEFRGLAGVSQGTPMLRNVSDPTLTVFRPRPEHANGIGVIVCPGGGWRILAWQHEGIDVSRWLSERGYTAFLLKYRVQGTPRMQRRSKPPWHKWQPRSKGRAPAPPRPAA